MIVHDKSSLIDSSLSLKTENVNSFARCFTAYLKYHILVVCRCICDAENVEAFNLRMCMLIMENSTLPVQIEAQLQNVRSSHLWTVSVLLHAYNFKNIHFYLFVIKILKNKYKLYIDINIYLCIMLSKKKIF